MEAKTLIEIMRENDCPFAAHISTWHYCLECLQERNSPEPEYYAKRLKETFEEIFLIYSKIDFNIQSEETGLDILKNVKNTISEMHPLFTDLIERLENSSEIPEEMLDKLQNFRSSVQEYVKEYAKLPAYNAYRRATKNYGGLTRAEWFRKGKPKIEVYDFSRI